MIGRPARKAKMPRAKRPLTEADAKKAMKSSASGKENDGASYSGKTVAELSEILKERSLPCSGKKADLVQRLVDADGTKPGGATSAGSEKVSCPRLSANACLSA